MNALKLMHISILVQLIVPTSEETASFLVIGVNATSHTAVLSSTYSSNYSAQVFTITPALQSAALQPSSSISMLAKVTSSPILTTKSTIRGLTNFYTTSVKISNNGSTNGTVYPLPHPNAWLIEQLLRIIETENYFRIADFCFAVLSFLTLMILSVPKSSKFFVHKNLILSIGISDFFPGILGNKVISPEIKSNEIACTVKTVLNYYWALAMFSWMAVEAFNIYLILAEVFDTRSKFQKHAFYLLFGYGSPALVTIVVVPLFWQQFSNSPTDAWIVKGPVAAYLAINVLAFIYILGFTLKHILTSNKYKGSFRKLIGTIRSFLVLYPILGIGYVLSFFLEENLIVFSWIYAVVNGFLAIIFFIFHVLLDSQVQEAALKAIGIRRNNSTQMTMRQSRMHTFRDRSSNKAYEHDMESKGNDSNINMQRI